MTADRSTVESWLRDLEAAADEHGDVTIPAGLYAGLVAVAAHVSAGRSAAFMHGRPYPDALARRTLGALDDAGLLPDRHPPTRPAPEEN